MQADTDGDGQTNLEEYLNGTDPMVLDIAVPVIDYLSAYWPFNAGEGAVVYDRSGNKNDADILGAVWTDGVSENALQFDGTTSQVVLPVDAFAKISEEITVAMWVYGGDTQAKNDSLLYATDIDGNRILNIHLPWSNEIVYWDAGDADSYDRVSKTATPVEYRGQWNHWAFTKNATTGVMNIYLNGELWHTGSNKFTVIGSVNEVVLSGQAAGSPRLNYEGAIDEVVLYHTELSAQEISELFSSLLE